MKSCEFCSRPHGQRVAVSTDGRLWAPSWRGPWRDEHGDEIDAEAVERQRQGFHAFECRVVELELPEHTTRGTAGELVALCQSCKHRHELSPKHPNAVKLDLDSVQASLF